MTDTLKSVIASCRDGYDPNALPVAQAQTIIGRYLPRVTATEQVPLLQSLGRTLAHTIVSPLDVPAHDNAAMDGYAVRGGDLQPGGTTLKRIGESFAGRPFKGRIGVGECVRIMTGAVMPPGADTVVIQEACLETDGLVQINAKPNIGDNRRFAGEDLARGKPALMAGTLIGSAELGLIASLGIASVAVVRRLRVAFFCTGDELASVGQPLADGQIYDSSRYTVYAMLTRLGVDAIDLGVVRDDPAAIDAALRDAAQRADAIISTGGVSVGEADFIRDLLAQLGEVVFWKIAMRPGRPMAFGRIGNAAFFGLPGNPVAVMVTFYHFVRHALLAMQGRTNAPLPTLHAIAAQPLRKKPGRTEYQRGIVARGADGRWHARLTGQQGSGVLRSMVEANCFIVLEHDTGDIAQGEPVMVMLFEGLT